MATNYWSTNLKTLRERRNLSQEVLANRLDISRSKLAAHESGKTINPPVEDLIRFSDYYRIPIDHLLRSDLSRMPESKIAELDGSAEARLKGQRIRILATTVDSSNNDNVELVPVKARAGYTAGYGDPEFIAGLPTASLPQLPRGQKYRMFPTIGDSMLPVPEGAFVIGQYCEDWTAIKPNTAAIVVTREQGIVFKIVTRLGKSLQLVSLNSQYAPYEVPMTDVLEVWTFHSFLASSLPVAGSTMDEMARSVNEIRTDLKKLLGKRS
jgi:transcriptional regulator with XRE-family HTH domain